MFLTSARGIRNRGKASRKRPGPGTAIPGCYGDDSTNYTRRTATNRFYISIGSGLLVFLTYAVNPSVELEIQSGAATMVAVIGLVLCLVWGLQIRALSGLIDIQIELAEEMEKELLFNFFQRQKESLDVPGGWLKYGIVEQSLPLLMTLPYLLILEAVYSDY